MKFFKSIFKQDPEERIRKKLDQIEIGEIAIELPKKLDEEDFRLVVMVATEYIANQNLNGRLIGQKGWFLPNGEFKLLEIFKKLENEGIIDLKEISKSWKLNEKRIFIALQDFMVENNYSSENIGRDDLKVHYIPYFKQIWMDSLSKYNFDDTIKFENIINNAKIKSQLRPKLETYSISWLSEPNSNFALGSDGILRLRNSIKEVLIEKISLDFENGIEEITYEKIATDFGITLEEVGDVLQELVEKKSLGEVTLYPLDEKLKPRR